MEKFLELAKRGKNEWWRYFISWGLIISVVVGANIVLILAILLPQLLRSGQEFDLANLEPLTVLVVSLIPFALLFGLMGVVSRLIHQRPFLTLITPLQHFSWKRFGQGALIWGLLVAITCLAEALLNPGRYQLQFQPVPFFRFLPFLLFLIPFQTSAEELIFRGYLPQGLGMLAKTPAIPVLLSSALFMLLHLANPEVAADPLLTSAYYLGMGLFLSAITLRDNRMELALGVHLATNLFVSLFVNTADSALQTPAVFMVTEIDPLYNLVSFLAAAGLFYLLFFLRPKKT